MSDEPTTHTEQSSNNNSKRAADRRSIPFNCSMPYSDFVKMEQEASKRGISRSELIRQAMQFYYHYYQHKSMDG